MPKLLLSCAVLALALAVPAMAQTPPPPTPNPAIANVIIICGRVTQYTAPTGTRNGVPYHEAAGSITIAERRVPIAAGTEYRVAQPIVGQPTCLDGRLNAAGQLVSYTATPGLPRCWGAGPGNIARYEPPTATRDGLIQLRIPGPPPPTADTLLFRIPAGTVMPPDVGQWPYCFFLELDGAGYAIVVRAVYEGTATRPPPGAPGPIASGGPGQAGRGSVGPPQLPSTSTR